MNTDELLGHYENVINELSDDLAIAMRQVQALAADIDRERHEFCPVLAHEECGECGWPAHCDVHRTSKMILAEATP